MRVQESRHTPTPLTWEIPTAVLATGLLLMLVALPAGQGAATWIASGEWVWPHNRLVESVVGLLQGHPGRGLSAEDRRLLPGDSLVLAAAIAFATVVVSATLVALAWASRTLGPHRAVGMASARDTREVLGARQLRRRGSQLRPDLTQRGRR